MITTDVVRGNQIRMSATFRNADTEALADPTSVTAGVREPDGTIASVSATRESLGLFHADFTPTKIGDHVFRFVGSGDVVAANEARFRVVSSFPA